MFSNDLQQVMKQKIKGQSFDENSGKRPKKIPKFL
jgi:hypothetical protein